MMSHFASICRARPWLGTFVEIRASGPITAIGAAIETAYRAIARVHRLMSIQDELSELSRLNAIAHLRPVVVHRWTFAVLLRAQALFRLTAGVFDPSAGAAMARVGSRRSFGDVALLPGRKVLFRQPLALDLGGIAKGFAVDRAIASLRGSGAVNGTVNAGGDLAVFGPDPVPVHVRHPANPGSLLELGLLQDGALATSAGYFASHTAGKGFNAIVDPATAKPFADTYSVSVIAPDCMTADGLTKAVALLGAAAAPCLARERAQAILVDTGGLVRQVGGSAI